MEEIKKILNTEEDVPLTSNYERLTREAEVFNQAKGNLNEFDCPICNNKGYVQKVVFEEMYNDYIPVIVKCSCTSKRATLNKAKRSGLGEYVDKRFDDYIVKDNWQKEIKTKALEYIKDDKKWFTILGQSGAGKTLIGCIIANYLLLVRNEEVLYITWTDFISKLKRDMMGDNSNGVSEYLDRVKNVEVLFLDELLKKYNDTDLKYIVEIINYRYVNRLKTIITSEKTIGELLDIDEATFSRVVERSDKYVINIAKDHSKNYRLRNVL